MKKYLPFLMLLLIFALLGALGSHVRNAFFYPHVVIEAPDGLTLTFVNRPTTDRESCEASTASTANLLGASCSQCKVRQQNCVKQLTPSMRNLLGDTPLAIPSARVPTGSVAFEATDPALALRTCLESQRQAVQPGHVTCYEAGSPRPYPSKEQKIVKSVRESYRIFGQVLIGIATVLATVLVFCRLTRTTWNFNRPHSFNVWPSKLTLAGFDALVLLCTFAVLAWPNLQEPTYWNNSQRNALIVYAVLVVMTISWFWFLLEHYGRRRPFWDELRETVRVLSLMTVVAGASYFLARLDTSPGLYLGIWATNLVLLPLGRSAAKGLLDAQGAWEQPYVIIGTGENARDAYRALRNEQGMGYRLMAFVDPGHLTISGSTIIRQQMAAAPTLQPYQPSESRLEVNPSSLNEGPAHITVNGQEFPVLVAEDSLESLLQQLGNPQIVVALDSLNNAASQLIVQSLTTTHRNIHVIPSIRGLPLFGTQLSHFFSHEVLFLTLRNNLSRRSLRWGKRAFDLMVAGLLLLLLSPLFFTLTYLIRKSGGPAFYGHNRVGRHGKPFMCLKFRSMRPDADRVLKELLERDPDAKAEWERDFKLKNDPRITSVGHFLRKSSLDELPQLFNVIKGEMSLVGPRPIVEEELRRYGNSASLYLEVLPGITGLWQVSGRNDIGYTERVALDAWYVQNWSVWYDIAILCKTFNVVFKHGGAY